MMMIRGEEESTVSPQTKYSQHCFAETKEKVMKTKQMINT